MDSFIRMMNSYIYQLSRELGDIAQELDGVGWAVVSGLLLICGWFFLKGSKIKAA